jgi:alpha-L-rhamnosidase
MRITHLRVNHWETPLGVDLRAPCFSWIVTDTTSCRQLKARLRVFQGGECICDTGVSTELDALGTELPLRLEPRTAYRWQVTVWGDGGDMAEGEAAFETGKMEEDWQGKWISPGQKQNAILEKSFDLPETPRSGRIYLTGLGLYRLFVNGRPAAGEVLTPGLNAYDRWVQVQTFDIGNLLQKGENRLEIWLAGGISRGRFSFTPAEGYEYCPYDCAIAETHIVTASGARVIPTDESWRWKSSPILESSIYDGEVWDPGREPERGQVRLCTPPTGRLRDRLSPPVRIVMERKPLRVLTTPAGQTVLDMGQNMVGWLRFPARGKRGQVLRLQFGEQLEKGCFSRANLRSAKARFVWICDGRERIAEAYFTWFGFRYVLLEGFDGPVDPEDFNGCVVSSDLEETGEITTGHEGLNRLIRNVQWSQRGNFLDVPTDCPQRDEREGWTGDAQVFADAACYNMDCAAFFTKYLADMWEEQEKAGGCVPYVVPFARNRSRGFEGGAVGWGDAAAVIPWTLWLHYGDRSLLRRQLCNMSAWMEWVAAQPDWASACRHFGDWLALDRPEEPAERVGKTDIGFLCLCYAFLTADRTAQAAKVLGETKLLKRASALAEGYRRKLRDAYFTPAGEILCRTQTACVLALHLGLAADRARTRAALLSLLRESGHLTTGFLGTPWLLAELPPKEAWELMLREDYPSWLYEVKLGATTVWERWNSLTEEGCFSETGMNSLNHYAYGSVTAWLYGYMCGIRPLPDSPGFRRFRWEPLPDRRVGFADCRLSSPCGDIVSQWRYGEEGLALRLTVPFGSEAEARLPDGRQELLGPGEHRFLIRDGEAAER